MCLHLLSVLSASRRQVRAYCARMALCQSDAGSTLITYVCLHQPQHARMFGIQSSSEGAGRATGAHLSKTVTFGDGRRK